MLRTNRNSPHTMTKVIYDSNMTITKFTDNINAEYIPQYVSPYLQQEIFNLLCSTDNYRGLSSVPFTRVSYEKFASLRYTPRLTWCYGQFNNESTASYHSHVFERKKITRYLENGKECPMCKSKEI